MTNFPTSLDSYSDIVCGDSQNPKDVVNNLQDAIENLEAKVGVDSSAVTTSHDYKLSGVTGADKAASLVGNETLENKTLTSPTINTPTIIVKDNDFTLEDNSDTTKKVVFELSGVSTETTRTLTVPNASDTLVVLAATQTLQNKTISSGSALDANADPNFTYGSYKRQAIINGNFDIWQRGTSFSTPASGTYTADRWTQVFDGTGSTVTISRQAFGIQTTVPGNPRYFLRYAQTVAGSGGTFRVIEQRIEDIDKFHQTTWTLSFYAKVGSAATITTSFDYNFGSGGSTTLFAQHPKSNSITTSWTLFTHTFTTNDLSTMTIGTGSYLQLNFSLPVNTTITLDLSEIQICAGSVALPFQPKIFQEEYQLCKRYYQKTFLYDTTPAQGAGTTSGAFTLVSNASSTFGIYYSFPVSMRTSPSVTTYNPVSSNANWRDVTNSADRTVTVAVNSEKGANISGTSGVASAFNQIHIALDAEL